MAAKAYALNDGCMACLQQRYNIVTYVRRFDIIIMSSSSWSSPRICDASVNTGTWYLDAAWELCPVV